MNRRERLLGQAVGNSARLTQYAKEIAGVGPFTREAFDRHQSHFAAMDALRRLEARGGWDEADLNDFAIVESALRGTSNQERRPE